MDAIVAQVQELAKYAGEVEKREMMVRLRDLTYSLEDPNDTVYRVGYHVRGDHQLLHQYGVLITNLAS